jgi:hypothetical protein
MKETENIEEVGAIITHVDAYDPEKPPYRVVVLIKKGIKHMMNGLHNRQQLIHSLRP